MGLSIDKLVLAGNAGQGVLTAGRVLARAGLARGLEVSFAPESGLEGTTRSVVAVVILAERPIESILVAVPDTVLALTVPARERLMARIKAGGLLIDGTGEPPSAGGPPLRDDLRRVPLPAGLLAAEAGAPGASALVALGAYGAAGRMLEPAALAAALLAELGRRDPRGLAGRRALEAGARFVTEKRYMKDHYVQALLRL